MPKRRKTSSDEKYLDARRIPAREGKPPELHEVMVAIPSVIAALDTSRIKKAQERPDWSLYRAELRDGNPYIVRDMCDRCGEVFIYPAWRKVRCVDHEAIGLTYFETGVCKDCINASVYVDKFLDGEPIGEVEAKKMFYGYAVEYERAWRLVLAAAPMHILTEADWQRACRFFNGCAFCGAPIEVRAKYFPTSLGGTHTAWNVIPLCSDCMNRHYAGRRDMSKPIHYYKVFSTNTHFNKTKTTRMYLLQQMRRYEIYMEPLVPFMQRFYETKTLEGSDEE